MQGTYTHIPETNYVPREHGVAAILLFLFMVLISLLAVLNLLYFYIIIIIIIIIIITGNRTTICRSYDPKPRHYTDWAIPAPFI